MPALLLHRLWGAQMWLIDRLVRMNLRSPNDAGSAALRWGLTVGVFLFSLAGYAVADSLTPSPDAAWATPFGGAVLIVALWTLAGGGLFSHITGRTLRRSRDIHITMIPSDIGKVSGIDVLSYSAATKALEEIGFRWMGDYAVPEAEGTIFRLLGHVEDRAYAELITVHDYEKRMQDEYFEAPTLEKGEVREPVGPQHAYPVIASHFVDGTVLFSTAFPFDPAQGLVQRDAWSVENFRLLGEDPSELLAAHLARRREMVRQGKQVRTHISDRAYGTAMRELYWRAAHSARVGRDTVDVMYAA